MDILYLTVMLFVFSWVIGGANLRTAYRMIIASCAGAVLFLIIINRPGSDFLLIFTRIAEGMTPGLVNFDLARSILLRGGVLASMLFIFFINRQLAFFAVSLILRQKKSGTLAAFYAPHNAIWVLSGSLVTIILTRLVRVEILEIIAWNVFIICVLIFLAQGCGIMMHILSQRTSAFRIAVNILFIVVLLSPLGTIAVTALILLGITENWRPIRLGAKASTPGPDF
jgi:hypothetical protein